MGEIGKKGASLIIPVAVIVLLSLSSAVQAQTSVSAQLCLILDGSGSIGSSNWDIIVEGVATAIEDSLPHDGSVELTIIQYGDGSLYAVVEVSPTIVTTANYQTIADNVRSIPYDNGPWTPTAHGIYLGWKEMNASQHFTTAERQVINLVTDGVPNARNFNATIDEDGDASIDSYDDVIAAKNISVNQGLDELDMEGIGITNTSRDWFKTWVLHPSPGHLAPDEGFIPGWIRVVENAEEFSLAISEKFEIILGRDTVGGTIIPTSWLITATPLILLGIAVVTALAYSGFKKIK